MSCDAPLDATVAIICIGVVLLLVGAVLLQHTLPIVRPVGASPAIRQRLVHVGALGSASILDEGPGVTPATVASASQTRKASIHNAAVLICAGGRYLVPAAAAVLVLRRLHGCQLPIQIWHSTPAELRPTTPAISAALTTLRGQPGVTFHDAAPPGSANAAAGGARGFQIKAYALHRTTVRHAILLDADTIPLLDVATLLRSAPYQRTGAVFWPDFANTRLLCLRDAESWLQVPRSGKQDQWTCDSSLVLFDRLAHWRALQVAYFINLNYRRAYWHMHGDKDTFWMALELVADREFTRVPGSAHTLQVRGLQARGWNIHLQRLDMQYTHLNGSVLLARLMERQQSGTAVADLFDGVLTHAGKPWLDSGLSLWTMIKHASAGRYVHGEWLYAHSTPKSVVEPLPAGIKRCLNEFADILPALRRGIPLVPASGGPSKVNRAH